MNLLMSSQGLPDLNASTVAVIGLGYVGLPLAVHIAQKSVEEPSSIVSKHLVLGYDISEERIAELTEGIDKTLEVSASTLKGSTNLTFVSTPSELIMADVYIVTVPTPIDKANQPNLDSLSSASITIGRILNEKSKLENHVKPIVIFESTVYPGATEEFCMPLIERYSKLKCNYDFYIGYSPERLSPGDPEHTLHNIVKVTSGSMPIAADWIDSFYSSFVTAGTYKASSIKVAEAAKVVENTQRDLNIALMNELSMIFKLMSIDFPDVLAAAGTKWNFHNFKPGLVGGHCIGVDPYYLTHISEQHGTNCSAVNIST